jgi:hypothetical protein
VKCSLLAPAASGSATAGCRPLLRKGRTPADWSGARRGEDVGQNARSLCVPLGGALLTHRTLASLHTFHLLTANNLDTQHHLGRKATNVRPERKGLPFQCFYLGREFADRDRPRDYIFS